MELFEGAVMVRALSHFDLCVRKTAGVCQRGLTWFRDNTILSSCQVLDELRNLAWRAVKMPPSVQVIKEQC